MDAKNILIIAILLAITPVAGCKKNTGTPPVTPSRAQRIVCLNPAAAEIISAIGAQNRLVAVTDFCDYPASMKNISSVGGTFNPNFEKIAATNCDLIIVMGQNLQVAQFAKVYNIEVMRIDLEGVAGVLDGITAIGEKLSCQDEANQLNNNITTQLKTIQQKTASLKTKTVFMSFYRSPGSLAAITTVGPNTLLNELITIAGGKNIFADINAPYQQISKEALLKRAPEVIIEPIADEQMKPEIINAMRQDWQNFPLIPAVKNNAVHMPSADLFFRPGPRIGSVTQQLAKIIHPEAFCD
jgi:iron complex transport system substrate-binding protein